MSERTHDLVDRLAAVPIFSGLARRHLKKLLDGAKTVDHQVGREVAVEGEGALGLHLILSGTAQVSIHGKSVRELKEDDYFGEISMIDGKKRSATVSVTTAMTTLVVPHVVFERLVRDEPDFARSLLLQLCARLREVEQA